MRICAFFILLMLISFSAHTADWKLYFENQLGMQFSIDIESIHQTPEKTILVWRRIASAENADKKRTLEILNEIDCTRRRFKTLEGTLLDYDENKITPLEKSGWEYFKPDEQSMAFMKAICKTK